jgi:uncharacterized protein
MLNKSINLSSSLLKVRQIFFIYSLAIIVVLITLNVAHINFKNGSFDSIYLILLMTTTCLGIIQSCKQLKINFIPIVGQLPRQNQWVKLFGLMIAFSIFSIGSFFVIFNFLSHVSPFFLEYSLRSRGVRIKHYLPYFPDTFLVFLTAVILIPITEEFIFRGFILNRWSEKWGWPSAIITSSIFYGLLNGHPISSSLFGVIMSLLYVKSKTIWIPVICHVFNNLIVFVFDLLIPSIFNTLKIKGGFTDIILLLNYFWWVGLLLMIISSPFIIKFIHSNFPRISSKSSQFKS